MSFKITKICENRIQQQSEVVEGNAEEYLKRAYPTLVNFYYDSDPLVGVDPGDQFSGSVSVSRDGKSIAIGDVLTFGSVKVYNIADGRQIGGEITGPAGNEFGVKVALNTNGTILAVGAPTKEGVIDFEGAVYTYKLTNGVWVTYGTVLLGDVENERFGTSIDFNQDDMMIIGQPANIGGSAGKVFIYGFVINDWLVRHTIESPSLQDGLFGTSVSFAQTGLRFAVGAPNIDTIYVYSYFNNAWDIKSNVNIYPGEFYGNSISISPDGIKLIAGAPENDFNGITNRGRVSIFNLGVSEETVAFDQIDSILGLTTNGGFGYSVGIIDSELAVVGQPFIGGASPGKVYVLRYNGTSYAYEGIPNVRETGATDVDFYGFDVSLREGLFGVGFLSSVSGSAVKIIGTLT